MSDSYSRRKALAALGLTGLTALAGCLGDDAVDGDDAGAGGDEEDADDHEDEHDDDGDGTVDATGEDHVTVTVAPDGEHTFDPAAIRIDSGATVRWEWGGGNHNVVPESQPSDADWEGYSALEGKGHEYEFTFDVEGEYEYICEPHAATMVGEIHVDGSDDEEESGDADAGSDDDGGYGSSDDDEESDDGSDDGGYGYGY